MSDTQSLLVRGTALLAFLLYAGALSGLYRWTKKAKTRTATALHALASVVFLIHVGLAFHWVHHWSHALAYEATARRTAEVVGWHWGGGLWVNYLFALCWPLEAARRLAGWRRAAMSRQPTAAVPDRAGRIADAVALFLWFQATVVFGQGWGRWIGAAVFLGMAIAAERARRANRRGPLSAGNAGAPGAVNDGWN